MRRRLSRDEDGNFIERRVVHTDIALARGGELADVLRYWQTLKGKEDVPTFGDIDPVRLAQLGVLGRLHVLNAANRDPALIRFDLYGNRVPLDNGRIYTGLAIGAHPVRIQAETVAADYDLVRQSAEPLFPGPEAARRGRLPLCAAGAAVLRQQRARRPAHGGRPSGAG